MPGLIANLHSGTKALVTHGKNVEITGKNLANVSNTSYARQRVVVGDRVQIQTATGTESSGIEALKISQLRDSFLDRQVTREISSRSGLEAQEQAYSRAQSSLNQHLNRTDDASSISNSTQSAGGGISEALSDFFNAFEGLSAKPTDIGERQMLVQKSSILVEKINAADQRIVQLQADMTGQASAEVQTVNSILERIADLNDQIGRSEIGNPDSAVDLRDQRQAQIEELAKYMDFEARIPAGGAGQVQIVAKTAGMADVVLLDKTTVVAPVSFNGTNFGAGTPPVTLELKSGSLPARIAARDGAVQDVRDGLAALATQLKTSVNAAYNPTGTTGDFFGNAPAGSLLSLDPGVTAAGLKTSDTGLSGANELALAVARVANQRFSTAGGDTIDGTPAEHLSKLTSNIGQEFRSTSERLENQKVLEKFVRDERDGVSGISMDEELTDLLKFQRAFQASARFVNVVDELLDLVVNRLGR